MDKGDSYRVGFLGVSTLSQMATGLGVLQKPLRELYIPHRKPGNPTSLPERYITVTSDGMIMSYYDQPNAPPVEDFFPIHCMLLWDAVRLITVKGTEKKDKKLVKCAFEPLDNDHSRIKDNLFCNLDKKHHYVQTQNHPPMFTCVIRRKSGVKALDAYVFICINEDETLGIIQALNQVHANFTSNQSQETGVFGYKPFTGKSSVRAPSGSPLVKIASSSHQQIQHAPSVDQRSTQQHNVTSILTNTSDAHGNQHQYNSNGRSSNVSTGSSNNSSFNRRLGNRSSFFNLSQEDLVGTQLSVASGSQEIFDEIEDQYDDGYQYLPHITHSLERQKRDFESDVIGSNNLDKARSHNTGSLDNNGAKSKNVSKDYLQNTSNIAPNSGYSENKPFSYALGKTKSSPKKLNTGEEFHPSKMGQGYSLLSGANEIPKRHASDSQQGSSSSPRSQRRDLPSSSVSDNQLTENANRQIFRELLHFQKQQQHHSQSQPPVGSDGSFDRPGQRAPQLRPPKSPGYLDRPPGSGRTKQDDSPEDNTAIAGGLPASDPFPPRDRKNSADAQKSKPVARVPPHMVTGVRVLPLNPSGPRRNTTDDIISPSKGDRPKSGIFLQSPTSPDKDNGRSFGSPPRRAQSQYNISNDISMFEEKSSSLKNKDNQQPKKGNWQFGPTTKGSSKESSLKSRSQQQKDLDNNMDDNKLGEKLLLSKKKDAEIASVMQNLRLDYKDTPTLTPGAPGGFNFEKSLGYFP